MPTSDEDLQAKSQEVQELREQVANTEAERIDQERSLANDITMQQLEAEEAQLRARLAVAERTREATTEGASAPLESAKEQMERAVLQQRAAENPEEVVATPEDQQQQSNGGDTGRQTQQPPPVRTTTNPNPTDDNDRKGGE